MSHDGAKEHIKRALVDVPRVVAALGLERGSARNKRGLLILCPVHQEKTPSFGVQIGREGTIQCKCFSCGFQGDVFALIAAAYHLSLPADFPEVLAVAGSLAGIEVQGPAGPAPPPPLPAPLAPPPSARPPATLEETIALTTAYRALGQLYPLEADHGLAEGLADRGLLEAASAEGWVALPAGTTWPTLLAAPAFAPLRPLWLRQRDGRVFPLWGDHRLVIPWRRSDGLVWTLQRRFALRDGSEDPKDQPAPPHGKARHVPKYVFPSADDYVPLQPMPYGTHRYEAFDHATEEIWITEGAADALSLGLLNAKGVLTRSGGKRPMAAVAVPGVTAFERFAEGLRPLVRGRRVHIALDGDAAGETNAAAWVKGVTTLGAASARFTPPPKGYKDWNVLLQAER